MPMCSQSNWKNLFVLPTNKWQTYIYVGDREIKPALLSKAIRIAHKAKLGETNKENEELNTILETVGKTL